jgi:hypothetical protein
VHAPLGRSRRAGAGREELHLARVGVQAAAG